MTRTWFFFVLTSLTITTAGFGQSNQQNVSANWTLEKIDRQAQLVANWMIAHPKGHSPLDWTYGAFYIGLTTLGLSDPTLPYLDQVRTLGKTHAWRLLPRTYHADDHCIAQSWLEMAAFDNNPTYAASIRQTYDYILTNPHQGLLDFSKRDNQKRWSWCDALFMSPTALIRLYGFTGDIRYLAFMDQEYQATTDFLYNQQDHFFFRDSRYFDRRTKNGQHVYWCRGNGWVFGSLPFILRDLPETWPTRGFYLNLFKEMAAAIKNAQQPDGAWHPSLADPKDPDLQEMSGTSFFTFGLLWGINNNILDSTEYLPCVQKAWQAISHNISQEGRLGWVQQIGDRPVDSYTAEDTEVYAVGAYLCAAVELRKHMVATTHQTRKTVTVTNPLSSYRSAETITLDWSALNMDPEKVRVFDVRNGTILPHQLFDSDSNGTPDQLLFKTYLLAQQSRSLLVFESETIPAAKQDAVCFSRHVPERMDDYAWENDRMAYRVYGPKVSEPPPVGEGLVSSGIDVWCKRVRHPVLNAWYKSKQYHTDHGEGLDFYKVGTGRGCGGLGVFNTGTCFVSGNWISSKTVAIGPVRTVFEITYAPWTCGPEVTVSETRRISLEAGSHLTRFESHLTLNGSATLLAGPGLDISCQRQHNGKLSTHPTQGWLTNFELAQEGKSTLSTALVVPENAALMTDPANNIYLLRTLNNSTTLVWYAGAAWSGAGDFVQSESWSTYIASFANALRNPLSVTVK